MKLGKRIICGLAAWGTLLALGMTGLTAAKADPTDPIPPGMSYGSLGTGATADAGSTVPLEPAAVAASSSAAMYRIFNPTTGEHFYTSSIQEAIANVTSGAWNYEGIGWYAPSIGASVYRLAAVPGTGSAGHLFTTSAQERDAALASKNPAGQSYWKCETGVGMPSCVGWYSDTAKTVPVYRAFYRPNGQHNYTAGIVEQRATIAAGWTDEGIAWYGVKGQVLAPEVNGRLTQLSVAYLNTLRVQAGRTELVADNDLMKWALAYATAALPVAIQTNDVNGVNDCTGAPSWVMATGNANCYADLTKNPLYTAGMPLDPLAVVWGDARSETMLTLLDYWWSETGKQMATWGNASLRSVLPNRVGAACVTSGVHILCAFTLGYK